MDLAMVGDLVRVAMSQYGAQLEPSEITDATSMAVDAKIDGLDVYDFVKELEATFGPVVWTIPWGRFSDQRASFYGCQTVLVPFWLLWRLYRWPFDGHWIPPTNGGDERLTVGHLTSVLFKGEWFDPEPQTR
jgi:hypothetical protein